MADTLMKEYIAAKTKGTFEAFLNNKMKAVAEAAQKPLDDMAEALTVAVQKLYPKAVLQTDYAQNTIAISPKAKDLSDAAETIEPNPTGKEL